MNGLKSRLDRRGTVTATQPTSTSDAARSPLLQVKDLAISFDTPHGLVSAVDGISFDVSERERVGIVGESGSGKSVTAQAMLGLLQGADIDGDIVFDGRDILTMPKAELRALRGSELSYVFQDPLAALDPVRTIGDQVMQPLRLRGVGRRAARARALDMLGRVGIPDPARRMDEYPHQFSGGMRQRAMIAMALIGEPRLVVADEPTTALDVRVQAKIIDLLYTLTDEQGVAVVFITHDLGILAGFTERVIVMRKGKIVESAPTDDIYYRSSHPYTLGLLRSIPRITGPIPRRLLTMEDAQTDAGQEVRIEAEERTEPSTTTVTAAIRQAAGTGGGALLEVEGLTKDFGWGARAHRALDDVSFTVGQGETIGIVGESGSGKSTTARCILRLIEPTGGSVRLAGEDVLSFRGSRLKEFRKTAQLVFQDPYSSLDPRMPVEELIAEGIHIHRPHEKPSVVRDEVVELLELVGLGAEHLPRRSSAFSGGQRQRIGIARALAVRPQILVCDEPVASLDVSIQAQILNLFADVKERLGLTVLFIAHDLATVRHLCERVVVMQSGQVREIGTREQIYTDPQDPYTQALMAAVPEPDPIEERKKLAARRAAAAQPATEGASR
ncbi:dipeptide ABC transporter ATP-binding protein [Microbacterium tumbae]